MEPCGLGSVQQVQQSCAKEGHHKMYGFGVFDECGHTLSVAVVALLLLLLCATP
jgi:hypothetical protein